MSDKQKEIYSSFTDEQLKIINEYCRDNMKKLKKVCYKRIRDICGDSNMDEDDLFSVAMDVLIKSVKKYDESQGSLDTFLQKNIYKKSNTYLRDTKYVSKRSNVQKDEDGKCTYIPNTPLDVPNDDGINLAEKVASDFKIEDNLSEEIGFSSDDTENWHPVVKDYLNGLSPLQRKIILMLSRNKDRDEICKTLNITYNHYENSLKRILADERIKPLRPLAEGKYYEVVTRQN